MTTHHPPELEAYGPYVSARRGDTTWQVADCSISPHGAEYARQFAASSEMQTTLETLLANSRLTSGEKAMIANALAKSSGRSIDEIVASAIQK